MKVFPVTLLFSIPEPRLSRLSVATNLYCKPQHHPKKLVSLPLRETLLPLSAIFRELFPVSWSTPTIAMCVFAIANLRMRSLAPGSFKLFLLNYIHGRGKEAISDESTDRTSWY